MPYYEHYKVGEYRVILQKGVFLWNARILYFHNSREYRVTDARVQKHEVVEDVEAILQIHHSEWQRVPIEGDGGK